MDEDMDDAPEASPPGAYEGLTLADMLSRAQRALYATLLDRIEGGTASKDDIKVLNALLVSNGMTIAVTDMQKRMIDVTPKPVKLPKYEANYDE